MGSETRSHSATTRKRQRPVPHQPALTERVPRRLQNTSVDTLERLAQNVSSEIDIDRAVARMISRC